MPSLVEVWSRVALYMSRDVLDRRYLALHGGEISAGKGREIVSHLAQAREYFESAATAGPLVRPLLQYYGVLGLARALILFRVPAARESNLVPRHGLKATLQGNELAELQLTIQRGTFDELLEATGNTQAFSADYMPMSNAFASTFTRYRSLEQRLVRPALDGTFTLATFVARIPQLKDVYEEALHRPASCHAVSVTIWTPETYTLLHVRDGRFAVPILEEFKTRLRLPTGAGPGKITSVAGLGGLDITIPHTSLEVMLASLPPLVGTGFSDTFVIEPYPDGWSINPLAFLFVGSFLLSTLVRYHATRWTALLNHEKGDALMPVLERLYRVIEAEFPARALEEFERPHD